MKLNFDITRSEYDIVKDILVRHLPQNCKIWVFGSRSKNKTRFNSDLDLALQDIKPLPQTIMIDLKEDFSESSLPYTVDIVDMNNIATDFKEIVEKQAIEFLIEKIPTTPKIRFPEFKDAGTWEEKRLGDLSSDGLNNGVFNDPKKVGTGYRLINVKDMYVEPYIDVSMLTFLELTLDEFNKNKVNFGDIFFTRSSLVKEGIAHSNINLSNEDNLTYDGHLIRIRPIKKTINSIFLNYYLKIYSVRKQLVSSGKTTTMTTIGQSEVSRTITKIPSLPEQTKIADFLSVVDEKIGLLTREHSLWQSYKKGMMQRIFSQSLRFTDDNDNPYPNWEEKKLGEVFNNAGGTALEKYASENGTHNFISIGNYSTEGKYIDNGQRIVLNIITKQKLLNKNDLVMVLNDKTQSGDIIGSSILIDEDNKFIYNQRSERLICSQFIYPKFAYFLLNSNKHRKLIVSLSQGGTQIYINFSSIKKIIISLPSLPEQQKIADFLSVIDEKINLVKQQLDKTKDFKKGLLQKMFV